MVIYLSFVSKHVSGAYSVLGPVLGLGLKRWKRHRPRLLYTDKESTCQCRRQGRFDPWPRKTPHAVEQLIACTTTMEPVLWSLGVATTEPAGHSY